MKLLLLKRHVLMISISAFASELQPIVGTHVSESCDQDLIIDYFPIGENNSIESFKGCDLC
jgi:hypothetical protein